MSLWLQVVGKIVRKTNTVIMLTESLILLKASLMVNLCLKGKNFLMYFLFVCKFLKRSVNILVFLKKKVFFRLNLILMVSMNLNQVGDLNNPNCFNNLNLGILWNSIFLNFLRWCFFLADLRLCIQ